MNVLEYSENRILILDGGSGTLLQDAGLPAGEYPERWNVTHPDVVTKIHRDYFNAGSDVVYTNTFGANILKFSENELEEIVRSAVSCARRAAEESSSDGEKFVALDIGPTGKLLKPLGDLGFEDAVGIFAKTVRLGVDAGVDLIVIETMNDAYETKAALLAAKENSALPVFVTNAYGEDGKLMTGADPAACAALLEGMGADCIGVNCSFGPEMLSPVVEKYLERSSVPVIFKPNAGLPSVVVGETVYDVSPDDFADSVFGLVKKGVRIVGGCCGTTPEYIKALKKRCGGFVPSPVKEKNNCTVSSYTHCVDLGASPVLIGERLNPTGKKLMKEALRSGNRDYILSEAIGQSDRGAHILDVNVGLPDIDEIAVLKDSVESIQAVCDLPLQIDTSDPAAMENALRVYNGKALINSVNGKEESMEKLFPLAKKYGGVLIALTLDESGIPDTAEGRLNIAGKIISRAAEYGISKKDIVFDPLCMAVSADKNAAEVTLRSLRLIEEATGCRTSLGVSNVSFGLPDRDPVNCAFFAAALENGLSAAIMNPYSDGMMRTYLSYRVLHGLDENCADYIAFSESSDKDKTAVSGECTLRDAVIKGMKERAAEITAKMLSDTDPMEIINGQVIPALDEVGRGFEKKTIYLPQLLMAAEAAKSAFDKVKSAVSRSGAVKYPVVLATVRGDIHDIGKNIVRLLLENYGYQVTDLGRDVPPEKVLEAVEATGAPVVGLSALMTTTVPSMKETVELLHREVPGVKIVVGGAVLTEEYARLIGADKYAADAMETVRYCDGIAL